MSPAPRRPRRDRGARARERLASSACKGETAAHTLLKAGEAFSSDWLDALRAVGSDCAEVGSQLDLVIIGDFGTDTDDEKALAMAVAMRRLGLIGNLSVIANYGNALLRARLAKGTVTVLGANDVPVAVGTSFGAKDDNYDFKTCSYLAPEDELEKESGQELAFSAIRQSKEAGHKLAFVLCSVCTDMAQILKDQRWDELAPGTVSHVVAMGGVVTENPNAPFQMDPDASNSVPDVGSAPSSTTRCARTAASGSSW